MQSEKVEIEQVELSESTTKEKKEYEKILLRERNRKLNIRAQNLIKLGCFDQYEKTSLDFSKLEKCAYEKPYKKIYELYKDENDNLFYVYGKVEGESNKPYAYDIIAIETVTDEEYNELYKAHSFEGVGIVKGLLISALVLLGLSILILLANVIYTLTQDYGFFDILSTLFTPFINIAMLLSLVGILFVTYRKFVGK